MQKKRRVNKKVVVTVICVVCAVVISIFVTVKTYALISTPHGGRVIFSLPCTTSAGRIGFWAINMRGKTITRVVYLYYPNPKMKRNYLPPGPGVTTLVLSGLPTDCTIPALVPVTVVERSVEMYGTAFGF